MGVETTTSIADIKKAFKKACVKGDFRHPDKGGDPEKVLLHSLSYASVQTTK